MKLESASTLPRTSIGVCPEFVQALGRGDLDSAAGCFARKGCLITPDATAVHGREQIRPLLAQMISRRMLIRVELSSAIGARDVVLARERWKIRTGDRSDSPLEQTLDPILVLRQIEGVWKLAIAALWGWRGHDEP